ncbi:hypothetical protein I4U23_023363 [Adineta vaga]|nr:hypothetical protein I4U23_023363 [Adineta vaga]
MLKFITFGILIFICISSTSALVCNIAQKVCGSKCYYPLGLQCLEGHVCKIGQHVCGGECYYDVGIHNCIEGHLCKLGQKLCNGQCYYPIGQTCVSRRWLI